MKKLCKENNIPTANFGIFENINEVEKFIKQNNLPIVVKADGLASGKGVFVCNTKDEALKRSKEIIEGKFKTSKKVVIEEFLKGEELSYFLVVDNVSFRFFGSAQDHKRVGEGDKGPNTGGMGAFSPANSLTNELEKKIINKIVEPTLNALKKMGHPYKGFLYTGLMIKNNEPFLIEYNIRMGDPECQVLMMRLKTNLDDVINAAINNTLKNLEIHWTKDNCMTVVLCSKGYPGMYKKNIEIKNLENLNLDPQDQIFHAGTVEKNGRVFSNGGRVLNVTSVDKTLINSRKKNA